MITEEEIIRRLEYLEMMNNNMTKYCGREGKIAWSGIYPKTNKQVVQMITQDEIIRRLEYLEMMNIKMNKYCWCEGKIAWSRIQPKTNKARIDLVKDDELYGNLFSIYFIIRFSER